jgi:molybdate transport system substrate-binding protein
MMPTKSGTQLHFRGAGLVVRSRRFLIGVALATAAIVSTGAGSAQSSKHELTISAAISLKDALNEIDSVYTSSHSGTALHFNVGGSGTLQQQIEQGAPVDIFISASPKEMDALDSKGMLLAGTRHDLVKNQVVLIVPSDRAGVSNFQDLTRAEVKNVAIGEPRTVPAGRYAQQVLTHFGVYDQLKPKFVFGKDVRQVLAYVETGNADAGIVYATDARITNRVKVVATAPEDSHAPVVYPVAIIKTSHDPSAAREFMQFLWGSQARDVFVKFGFVPSGA